MPESLPGITRLDVAIPDRASIALANILQGNSVGAAHAMFAPDKLSPQEHQDMVDRYFGPGESVLKSAARFATNPLTLLAFALVWKWPAPSMSMLKPTMESLAKYDKYTPAFLRWMSGLNELFHGTGVDDAFAYFTRKRADFVNKYLGQGLGAGLDEFVTKTGALPTPKREMAMGFHWDMEQEGYADAFSKTLNGLLRKAGSSFRITSSDLRPLKELEGAEKQLIDRTRSTTELLYDDIIKRAEKEGVLGQLLRDVNRQSLADFSEMTAPQRIKNWFGHVLHRDEMAVRRSFEEIGEEVMGDPAKQVRGTTIDRAQILSGAEHVTSGHLADRKNRMLPNARQIRQLADDGVVSPRLADAIDRVQEFAQNKYGVQFPEYDLRMTHAVSHAVNSLGRAAVWRIPDARYGAGVGTWVMDRTRELATGSYSAKRNAQLLIDTYIPAALGRSSIEQYARGLEWGAMKNWTAKQLENPTVKRVLGDKLHNTLNEMLHFGTGLTTWHGAGGKIASWFYLSTLGFNPATAAQNLLQTAVTTAGLVKPKYLMQGLQETWKGYTKVLSATAKGMPEHEALAKYFPEFASQGLEIEGLHADLIAGSKEVIPGILEATRKDKGLSGKFRRLSDAALALFSKTERFNHLLSFNAARAQGMAEGLASETAGEIAAKVVRLGQQWSGPFATPSGLINKWAPFRQFATFPVKTGAFLGLSAAGALGMGPGGVFHPGTLGRAMIGSMIAYEGGRALFDKDLSGSLLFGAAPGPAAQGPFAPLPVVPPAIATLGAIGLDLARGEGFNETARTLPLFVPGGVAASRALPLLTDAGPQIGSVVGRAYADYSRRGPDGKVPVYTYSGGMQGRFSDWELYKRAMGLGSDDPQKEAATVRYIVRQREEIRKRRRAYIDRLMGGDPEEAQRISLQYEQDFGIGPITVKKSDLKAYTMRHDIARLERLVDTLPPEARALYGNVIGVSLSNAMPNMLGIDPAMLTSGTATSRRPGGIPMNQPSLFSGQ